MQENAVCGSLSRQESAKNLASDSNSSYASGEPEPLHNRLNYPKNPGSSGVPKSVSATDFSSVLPAANSTAFSELALIVSAWPRLPEHIRQAILLLAGVVASPVKPSAQHCPIEGNSNDEVVNGGAGGGDGASGNGGGNGNGGGGGAADDDDRDDAKGVIPV
jgi:uncharacterized membrane protein YgcG